MVQMLIVNKSKLYKDQGHKHFPRARYVHEFVGSTLGSSMATGLISAFKGLIMEEGEQVKEANADSVGKTYRL